MSDLNLGPAEEAGKGKAIGIAAGVMVLIAAAVYFLMPKHVMKVTVSHEGFVAPHTVSKALAGGIKVIGVPGEEDQTLYVAVDLHLENQLSMPVYLTGETVTIDATLPSGEAAEIRTVAPIDFNRIVPSFPELGPMLTKPLATDATIPAKSSMDGTVLLMVPGATEADWKAKKGATLTLVMANQGEQTVALP